MAFNKKSGLALLLITLGAIVLFHKLGMHFHLMGYLIPLAIAGLGVVGIRNGKKIGWLFAILGILILLGKLTWIFAIIFGVVLIGCGLSMLKGRTSSRMHDL
jgi:hypothetical protein